MDELSVKDNLSQGIRRPVCHEKGFKTVAAMLGIKFFNHSGRSFFGMKEALIGASALAGHEKILIMDEPGPPGFGVQRNHPGIYEAVHTGWGNHHFIL